MNSGKLGVGRGVLLVVGVTCEENYVDPVLDQLAQGCDSSRLAAVISCRCECVVYSCGESRNVLKGSDCGLDFGCVEVILVVAIREWVWYKPILICQ